MAPLNVPKMNVLLSFNGNFINKFSFLSVTLWGVYEGAVEVLQGCITGQLIYMRGLS